jgi:2-polyprenyl-3-methyl-5-hydroxy-6-metoxy-1,4-benzoquinol methylase
MSRAEYKPFERDIAAFGRYQYTGSERFSTVRANRRFSDMILGAVDLRGRHVIDVGCGDGTYTVLLALESGALSMVGIDPAESAVAAARLHSAPAQVSFRHGTASDLVAEGARFDVAVYRGVLHHVANPAMEIEQSLRLAPEVVILEPNGLNPVLKLLERWSPYHREHDEQSYAAASYRRWIAAAGGRIRRVQYFGLVPHFSPAWLARAGAALEPVVERLPGLRIPVCGQILIVAERA